MLDKVLDKTKEIIGSEKNDGTWIIIGITLENVILTTWFIKNDNILSATVSSGSIISSSIISSIKIGGTDKMLVESW